MDLISIENVISHGNEDLNRFNMASLTSKTGDYVAGREVHASPLTRYNKKTIGD